MSIFFTIVKRAFSIAVLCIFVGFCWFNQDALIKINELPLENLLITILCYFLVHIGTAFSSSYLLKTNGYPAKTLDLFAVNSYSSVLGYLSFFRAGYYLGKVYLYKKLYNTPISSALGMIAYVSFMMILSSAVIGLVAAVVSWVYLDQRIPFSYWVVLSSAILLVFLIISSLFYAPMLSMLPTKVQAWLKNLTTVFINMPKVGFVNLFFVLSAGVFFQALGLNWIFSGFNLHIPFIYFIFIAVFSNLSLIISLTPSNIGIREGVILLLLAHLDIAATEIFSVLVIDRVLQFVMVFIFSLSGYKKIHLPIKE